MWIILTRFIKNAQPTPNCKNHSQLAPFHVRPHKIICIITEERRQERCDNSNNDDDYIDGCKNARVNPPSSSFILTYGKWRKEMRKKSGSA